MNYPDFLASKMRPPTPNPVPHGDLHPALFDWQRSVVEWALRRGVAGLFEDCGLGKSLQELAWADAVMRHVNRPVLLLSPLGAALQLCAEAEKFSFDVTRIYAAKDVTGPGLYVANYERADHFDYSAFGGLVLDESSILKDVGSKTRRFLTESVRGISYRLSCSATPCPNDVAELGNQVEFLGIMSRAAMLATFFINDQKADPARGKWRLKGHARTAFYDWCASWSVFLRSPADLGYSADGYKLPPLRESLLLVDVPPRDTGTLFEVEARSLSDLREIRQSSIPQRLDALLANSPAGDGPRVTWCGLNAEADALRGAFPDATEVRGSDDPQAKEEALLAFARGEIDHLITKPSIAGHGMNWQCASRQTFFGLDHSWEKLYQSSRRLWRFGQRRPVEMQIVLSRPAARVWTVIQEKRDMTERMNAELVERMKLSMQREVRGESVGVPSAPRELVEGKGWQFYNGDSIDISRGVSSDSVGYQIFSPPFPDVYAYSDSPRDMGNATWEEFFQQFAFLAEEMLRVGLPGRLATIHCMDIPIMKSKAGYVGLRDFPGEIVRLFESKGWRYFAKRMIWKDPVVENARTHSLGHGNLLRDSTKSRAGLPDYLVTFQKPGANAHPVEHDSHDFPVEQWQRWASPCWSSRECSREDAARLKAPPDWMLAPVWYDIRQSDTLQKSSAREEDDEKHICPLQLMVIDRCIEMWSAPDDLVASWFAGIGSEGFVAVKKGRRALLCELKRSYFEQGVRNLQAAEQFCEQPMLF